MQSQRAHFAQTRLVERGAGDEEQQPDQAEIESWVDLEYKAYKKGNQRTNGFFANTIAQHLFIALWEYLATVKNVTPEIDSAYWKMKFTIEEDFEEQLEAEEGETEQDLAVPKQKVEVVAKVEDRGAEFKPRYYMGFRRKAGDARLYSKFVKEVMAEKLAMFVEKA